MLYICDFFSFGVKGENGSEILANWQNPANDGYYYMAALLAQDVPSISWPAGSVPIDDFGQPQTDLMSLNTNGWPGERLGGNEDNNGRNDRWFHSDILEVSYFYTFRLFDLLVEKGHLK